MAHRDDDVAAASDELEQVVRRGAGREPLVDAEFGPRPPSRSPLPVSRARRSGLVKTSVGFVGRRGRSPSPRACSRPLGRSGAQLVRIDPAPPFACRARNRRMRAG